MTERSVIGLRWASVALALGASGPLTGTEHDHPSSEQRPAWPASTASVIPGTGQGHYYYVADVVGEWEEESEDGKATTSLTPLARVRPAARVRYAGPRDGEPGALLILRDPRSLGKATLRCDAGRSCSTPFELVKLRFERRGAPVPAGTGALYGAVAERDAMRGRIRLVGARADAGASGLDADVLVLASERGSVDLSALRSAVAPSGGWVARFCSLAPEVDVDECLATRRILPADCESSATKCTPGVEGAVRIDVFTRERSMLSSLPIASGFAVLVPPQAQRAALAERDRLLAPIRSERSATGVEEWRALLAAAAMAVERASR